MKWRLYSDSLYRKVSDDMGKKRIIDAENTAQKAKKGLFSIIFSRAGIILLLILIQLGLFFATSVHL